MRDLREQSIRRRLWALVRSQYGLITHEQLLELGYSTKAIKHRIAIGRLHPVYVGVYVVGRPALTQEGRLMAAVLACGPAALISHWSAAVHYGIWRDWRGAIHVTSPSQRRREGIVVHRRAVELGHYHRGIPVTSPAQTIVDLAACLALDPLEGVINEADNHGLIDPETLRASLDEFAGVPGVARLRRALDHRTFTMTDSQLERRFLPIARRAGLGRPLTQAWVNDFRVDFYWPDLGLVVETDGLTYHRTAQQQARDLRRDQIHVAAGLTSLRFSRAQVRFEPAQVEDVLRKAQGLLRPLK